MAASFSGAAIITIIGKIMYIYRIEHPSDNKGPYYRCYGDPLRFDDELSDMFRAHSDCVHPSIHADHEVESNRYKTPAERYAFFCGAGKCCFTSFDMLKDWFDGYLLRLGDLGYKMAIYNADMLYEMEFQALYIGGQLLEHMDLQEVAQL